MNALRFLCVHTFWQPIFFCIIGLSALAAAFLALGRSKTDSPSPPPVVEVAEAVQRNVPIYKEWSGTLDGLVNSKILAQVSGQLTQQRYQEGHLIKKGQVLYEIDSRELQLSLDEALVQLARQQTVLKTAHNDLQRIKRLLPEGAVSARDHNKALGQVALAQADVQSAKIALEKARLQLDRTKILSPIDGVAGLSNVAIGDFVGPGSGTTELTTVSQLHPIKAYIPMSEQEYLYFSQQNRQARTGPSQLILADGSTHPHAGHFLFTDRAVNAKTGTIQVVFLFPNPDNRLRPGQYARVRLVLDSQTLALLVPKRAVKERQGQHRVAVVKPNRTVEWRSIRVAESIGNAWRVDAGLKAGEWVIVEAVATMRSGVTVMPKPSAQLLSAVR